MSEELKHKLGKLDREEAAANAELAGNNHGKPKKLAKKKKGGH